MVTNHNQAWPDNKHFPSPADRPERTGCSVFTDALKGLPSQTLGEVRKTGETSGSHYVSCAGNQYQLRSSSCSLMKDWSMRNPFKQATHPLACLPQLVWPEEGGTGKEEERNGGGTGQLGRDGFPSKCLQLRARLTDWSLYTILWL